MNLLQKLILDEDEIKKSRLVIEVANSSEVEPKITL